MNSIGSEASIARLLWTALSDQGRRRKNNEDAWSAFSLGPVLASIPERPEIWPQAGFLLVVSDGMGGANAGEVASQFCVAHLPKMLHSRRDESDRGTAMKSALLETHQALIREARADRAKAGMGATVSALWLHADGTLVLGHVGDSRIYRRTGVEWELLTADQSVGAGLVRRGEMTPEEVSRLRYRAMLEQVMGGEGAPLEPQVCVERWSLTQDFLLCSDGLYGPLEAHVPELFEEAVNQGGLAARAQWLVDRANAAGGPDNITVLLARFVPGDG